MKAGKTVQELAEAILKTHKTKRDYFADTKALTMVPVERPNTTADVALQFNVGGEQRQYRPTTLCLEQVADRVGIPRKYAERMRTEAPELLCRNVNHWFTNKPEKRMLRTLNHDQNVVRAFLSDKYRPLDNHDLFAAVMPKLIEAGCEIRSAEVTETRLYIQASTPRIQAIIDQNVVIGTHNRIQRTVQAGVIIGNSEVGCGSLFIDPIMYDLVCTNGLIMQRTLRRNHVGRSNEVFGDENTYELFSNETRKLDDDALWAKVRDVTTATLNEVKFQENILRLTETQKQVLAKDATGITPVVEAVAERFNFVDIEKANLLLHFAQGADFSKYGLINAVTRTAQDVESYDRAVELERLGGTIIELPASDFAKN